ncbi:MAG: histone deacetylase [Thermoplasmata archaeon]|nr:MAG: histone deacetylase [Thermoplasmata archaeon]
MKVVYSERYLEHRHAGYHPERPERLLSIVEGLRSVGMWEEELLLTPKAASAEELHLVHSEEHVRRIKDFGVGWIDPDTFHDTETYDIALLAAGGGATAALWSWDKKEPAVALLRPPGHHAGWDYNGGFCYFNNIALAAKLLQRDRRAGRVAIVDIDVHHGNGTHDIFLKDPSVLYISTHQWGIYPGTGPLTEVGHGEGEGFTVNLPMSSGHGDGTFRMTFEDVVVPILKQFRPEQILVSLGVDAHYMDPLASLSLSSPGYVELLMQLKELADRVCEGRITFMLEGGYHLEALTEVFAGLCLSLVGRGEEAAYRYGSVMDSGDSAHLKGFREQLSSYWRV